MLPDGSHVTCMIRGMLPGPDLYYTDPAQHLNNLDGLDGDLSDVCMFLPSRVKVDGCVTAMSALRRRRRHAFQRLARRRRVEEGQRVENRRAPGGGPDD